ncbi:hypothetical protein GCM10017607_01460 [Microbacterium thalassium]|nr:hypothetical protein GCM10017607_01460 [Microbacterium thalassium]
MTPPINSSHSSSRLRRTKPRSPRSPDVAGSSEAGVDMAATSSSDGAVCPGAHRRAVDPTPDPPADPGARAARGRTRLCRAAGQPTRLSPVRHGATDPAGAVRA